MNAVNSGRHKIPTARAGAAVMLISGLLVPGATLVPSSGVAWVATEAIPFTDTPTSGTPAGSTSCGGPRREWRFGWIEGAQDVDAPPQRGVTACLAVYRLSE